MELFRMAGSLLIPKEAKPGGTFEKQTKRKGGRLSSIGRKFANAGKMMMNVSLLAAAAIAAAVVGITRAMRGMVQDLNQIGSAASQIGVTAETYQELEYWGSQNGVSAASMESAVSEVNLMMGKAMQGNDRAAETLRKYGVDMKKLEAGSLETDQALETIIQSLSEIENEQRRSAAAAEIFGTQIGRELMPALKDGSMSFDEARKQTERLGLVVSDDAVKAAQQLQNSWENIRLVLDVFKRDAILLFFPVMTRLINWVEHNMPEILNVFRSVFGYIAGNVMSWVVLFRDHMLPTYKQQYEMIMEIMPQIWERLSQTFEKLQETIDSFIELSAIVWELWGVDVKNQFNLVVNYMVEGFENGTSALLGLLEFWAGLFTGDWERAGEGFKDFWKGFMDQVKLVVSTLFGFAKGGPLGWGQDIIEGLAEGISSMGVGPVESITDTFPDIKDTQPHAQMGASHGVPADPKTAVHQTGRIRLEGVDKEGRTVGTKEVVIDGNVIYLGA